MEELPIIQKTYDLILWYAPHINKWPRDTKFILGDRIQNALYDLLETLITARYDPQRLAILQKTNARLDTLRFLTRLSRDLKIMDIRRYEYASKAMVDIGRDLGGWIKQQKGKLA